MKLKVRNTHNISTISEFSPQMIVDICNKITQRFIFENSDVQMYSLFATLYSVYFQNALKK